MNAAMRLPPIPVETAEEQRQQNQQPQQPVDNSRETFYDFALLVDLMRVAGSFFSR